MSGRSLWPDTLVCAAIVLCTSSGLVGCTPEIVSEQTPFMENIGDVDMTARELRVRVVEFGRHFAASVERAANTIASNSSDTASGTDARRHATLWKARAIPAAQEAVLQIDPLMALVDVWALTLQMEDFFESGPGVDWFPQDGGHALAASRALVGDIRALARRISVTGEIAPYEEEIEIWVGNHPIEDDLFLRDSVIGSGADLLGDQDGAFAFVQDMNTTTREIGYRLAFYNEYLLKQLRWAADLGGGDMLRQPAVDSLLRAIHSTLGVADGLTDELGLLAAREREAILVALADERSLAFQDVDRQRHAMIAALTAERMAVLTALTREREAAMQAISREREVTLESIDAMYDDAKRESRAAIDYAFRRFAVLGLFAFVGLLIGAVFLMLVYRRLTRLDRSS